jgi:hypothetical protein
VGIISKRKEAGRQQSKAENEKLPSKGRSRNLEISPASSSSSGMCLFVSVSSRHPSSSFNLHSTKEENIPL